MRLQATLMVIAVCSVTTFGSEQTATAGEVMQNHSSPVDQTDVTAGKQLYAQNCSHCHGISMVNPGNASFDLRKFPHGERERFWEALNNGKNGRMPSWGDILSSDEIARIWVYVQTGGS